MRNIVVIVISLAAAMCITGCGNDQVGVMNTRELMQVEEIKAISEQGQKELMTYQAQVRKELSECKTEDEKQAKIKIYMDKAKGVREGTTKKVEETVAAAADKVKKEKNLVGVFDKKVVFSSAVDVTDDVKKAIAESVKKDKPEDVKKDAVKESDKAKDAKVPKAEAKADAKADGKDGSSENGKNN